LRKIILAGTKALSGSNVQPWEFIIIDDPTIIEQIAQCKYRQSLKMALSGDPKVTRQIAEHKCQQTLEVVVSTKMVVTQKEAYQNCTVIAVCNAKGHGDQRKAWMNIENIASTWMCIQNMALAATADGLGIMPSIFREEDKTAVERLLGIPEDYELTSVILIGVQKEVPGERVGIMRPELSCLHRNRFGVVATL